MDNPFEEILDEIRELKEGLNLLQKSVLQSTSSQIEIIDRDELMKRLGITKPTAIRWGRKGVIPELHIGTTIRYNWPAVIQALEKKK